MHLPLSICQRSPSICKEAVMNGQVADARLHLLVAHHEFQWLLGLFPDLQAAVASIPDYGLVGHRLWTVLFTD